MERNLTSSHLAAKMGIATALVRSWVDGTTQPDNRQLKVQYAYDAGGNRTSVQRAGGASVSYGYDNIGQLTSAVGVEPDCTTVRGNENFGYSYDPAGNLATRNNNTLAQTFATGNANQLTNISRNDLLTVAGNLTSSPNGLSINEQDATIYNDLTFAATNGVAINDGLNTLTAIVTTASSTMTNSMTKTLPASVSFAYDLNGNMTSDGLHGYDYDCANQLTRITVTNNWKTEYAYDGFGRRRVRKEFVWQNGQWLTANEVHYIYDGMLVIQERNAINVPMVTYTRGSDLSGTMQGAGGIGGLLARTDANGSAFYHTDGNGNVTALVNAADGMALANYEYGPFGEVIRATGPMAKVNPFRFSTKYQDDESDLLYYGYRYYNPSTGRWPNRDPLCEIAVASVLSYDSYKNIQDEDRLAKRWIMLVMSEEKKSWLAEARFIIEGQTYSDNSELVVLNSVADLYRFAKNNPINFYDLNGLCDMGTSHEGDGLLGHSTITVGGSDYGFGPVGHPVWGALWTTGTTSGWETPTPPATDIPLETKNFGNFVDDIGGKCSCNCDPARHQHCADYYKKTWDGTLYQFPSRTCRSYVQAIIDNCCLQVKHSGRGGK